MLSSGLPQAPGRQGFVYHKTNRHRANRRPARPPGRRGAKAARFYSFLKGSDAKVHATKVTRQAGEYGYSSLRLSGTRTGDLLEAAAERCQRLVNRAVTDAAARKKQGRLIGLLLGSPFLIASLFAILLAPAIGLPATLTAAAAAFAVPFLLAALVMLTGRAGLAGIATLAFGAAALTAIVAAAGGLASPAALVLAALAFEAGWVNRTRVAVFTGLAAGVAALLAQLLLAQPLLAQHFTPGTASAVHWLIPLVYLAFVLPRVGAWLDDYREARPDERHALEDIVEAVVLRMDFAGEVAEASAQARRILGLAPELLLSSGLFDRVHVADRVGYLYALADLRDREGFRRVEARIRVPGAAGDADRDFRPFVIDMMRPAADDRLITMLLRQADASAQAADAADAIERVEVAKNRMLAAVSHELRTPLNSIIGFSDLMLHGLAGNFADARQKEYVGLVKESGSHLLSLVNSILDVSRLEAGAFNARPEPFRFEDAVEMCRSMLAQQAREKGIALVTQIPSEIGEIHADKRAVKQMLINLICNAIKFTPNGGSVTVGAKRSGSHLHFWVADTGIGITRHDLARLGQPFVQVDNDYTRSFEGAGLGLSLVKGLVALHQGSMSIDSEPDHGTTVNIDLPVEQLVSNAPLGHAIELAEILAMAGKRSKEAPHGTFRKTA